MLKRVKEEQLTGELGELWINCFRHLSVEPREGLDSCALTPPNLGQ